MDAGAGKWVDRDSGPVVRPYALTGGRTEPATGVMLDLIAIVVAAPRGSTDLTGLSPEYRKILALCGQPVTVADVASDTALPLGVVRVLLADLLVQGRLTVMQQRHAGERPSADLLEEVLHGLRAL
ncbi:MAG TPA: DUF742 domain-containing protein [Streptosporangiaceae bacterium]|jgi:hypothetical protein|nr:DUF742 domain-containing protein [Streptosporangiaceae bacterium]